MTTSGSITYNETAQTIMTDALTLLGVYNTSETPSTNDFNFCSNALNRLLKGWEGQGIHLWKESEAIIPLTVGQGSYSLYAGSPVNAGDAAVQTTLTVTANGSNAITVASVLGMNVNDNIGVSLDNNTIFWSTVNAINTSTLVITLNTSVTSQATSGNTVISYTNQLARPLNITNIRYCYNNGLERRIKKAGRTEFMQLPNKSMQAPCTMFYYSPQLTNGLLYIWPTPSNTNDNLHISYLQTIQDVGSSSNTLDIPQEWLDVITFNLAVRIAPAYGVVLSQTNPDIVSQAASLLQEMLAWDSEEGSVRLVPNWRTDDR